MRSLGEEGGGLGGGRMGDSVAFLIFRDNELFGDMQIMALHSVIHPFLRASKLQKLCILFFYM